MAEKSATIRSVSRGSLLTRRSAATSPRETESSSPPSRELGVADRDVATIQKIGIRQYAVDLVRRTRYADFGPTLAAEVLLEKHDLKIGRETLRKWMVGDGAGRNAGDESAYSGWGGGT